MTSIEQASRKYDAIADRYEEMFFYVADFGARLIDVARNCVVTAIDASPRMIARLSADHPAVSAHVMDAARLGFGSASFDLVTAGFVAPAGTPAPAPDADSGPLAADRLELSMS